MSTADQQRQLWEASRQFVRGEISSERLEQIELAYSLSQKDAIFAVATRNNRRIFRIVFFVLSIIIMVFTFFVFYITQNYLSFGILVGLIPLLIDALYSLIRYLFPRDDKYYEQMALKIQEKQRAKKKRQRVKKGITFFE